MKKFISLLTALLILTSLTACVPDSDDYISGTKFDIPEYETDTFSRYENKDHGIIIEFPERLERVGNLDLDGYISFENEDVSLKVYVPDTDTDTIMSVEEYTDKYMDFPKNEESENIKYGKSTGYKSVVRKNGNITIEFIVKGVDGFYRFSYTCLEENFATNKAQFEEIFATIRIDDGIYNKLNRMAARYKELLDYVTSMQYVNDSDYANHCLNNYGISNDERSRQEALDTYRSIKEELTKIIDYDRPDDEEYEDDWTKIYAEAEKMISVCDEAIAAIERGDIEEAQRLARGSVTYELSDVSSSFLSILNAEIAEY